MRCPFCSNRLRVVRSGSDIIDVCPECRGIWFDSGEFAGFAKRLSQSEKVSPEATKFFQPRKVKNLYSLKEKVRVCPRCSTAMQKFNYAGDSNVFLDKCSKCGGLWADGGEVLQVASYLKEDPTVLAVGRQIAEMGRLAQETEEEDSIPSYFIFFPRFVIPISDDIPRDKFPLVTLLLIGFCAVVFVIQNFVSGDQAEFINRFGFVPEHFWEVGLISSMFMHADIFHLLFNMLFLWLFGDNVEDVFTRCGYLGFCIGCGLFASFLHALFNWGSVTPVIGASGFISGVMGAYIVFYPHANITLLCCYRTVEVSALLYIVGWFVLQLVAVFVQRGEVATNVAWFAHIGGFVFGVVAAFVKKSDTRVVEPAK